MAALTRYFGNGSGRDSYIIRTLGGGHIKDGTFDDRPNLRLGKLFGGGLQDSELKKMYKA